MPYTPPSQHSSPAGSVSASPASSTQQRPSSASYFHAQPSPPRSPGPRPNLPRSNSSTSYMQRSRRGTLYVPNGSLDTTHESLSLQTKDPSIASSVRQSPPPATDSAAPMPAMAIVSPPDSGQNSSDDDDIRGQPVTSLQQLHDVVRRLEVNRKSPPAADRAASQPSAAVERPTTPPGQLSATARRISHSRSSSEIPMYSSVSISNVPSQCASDAEDSDDELSAKPPLIRKKSGELVKPAIRPKVRRKPSSMPGTPTFSKAVHFNEDIEQVRHFLHSERPIAVSAGTSPVEVFDDETEFPWSQSKPKSSDLSVRLPNFPRDSHERQTAPVRLERLSLSTDKKHLIGVILVANLAFTKSVRARFTFDHWRTTSEVTAEFNRDVRQPVRTDNYDQFNFSVKLSDQGNINAKTMFICIRYHVNGTDYWDNNSGANYQVEFDVKESSAPAARVSPGPASGAIPRSRHNTAASRQPRSMPSFDDDFSTGDGGLAFQFRNQPLAKKPSFDLPDTPPTLKRPVTTGNQFGSRYDFGASLSAALSQAQTSLGDRSRLQRQEVPLAGVPGGVDSPRPDTLLASNKSLDSRAYQEFVSKFCFFGSGHAKGGSPKGQSPDQADSNLASPADDGEHSPSTAALGTDGASDNVSPTVATSGIKAHVSHIEQVPSPAPATVEQRYPQTGRSRSNSPATGRHVGMSSPPMFGYPYSVNYPGSYFSGSTTPPAIRG